MVDIERILAEMAFAVAYEQYAKWSREGRGEPRKSAGSAQTSPSRVIAQQLYEQAGGANIEMTLGFDDDHPIRDVRTAAAKLAALGKRRDRVLVYSASYK